MVMSLNQVQAMCGNSVSSSQSRVQNVQRFFSVMDQMGLPCFQATDLEKGSMKIVLDCLLTLQTQFMPNVVRSNGNGNDSNSRSKVFGERAVFYGSPSPKEEPFRMLSFPYFGEERRTQRGLHSPVKPEPSTTISHHGGHKFHEAFQLKQGSYTITMKSNSLDNAPTQSLLSVVNGILDESIERKNGEIPHRVACLLRKVVQEIEQRIATQAEHWRTQNDLFKAREEKYQSRIRVLEALATGTSEETQIVMNQLQQIKSEKHKIEEKKKVEEDVTRMIKKNDDHNQEIASLKKELEEVRKMMQENNDHNKEIASLKQELEVAQRRMKENENNNQEVTALKQELETAQRKTNENGNHNQEVEALKQELETARRRIKENDEQNKELAALKQEMEVNKKIYELQSSQTKEAKGAQQELEKRLKEMESHLTESRKRAKELEALPESKCEWWNKKENIYHIFTEFQLGPLRVCFDLICIVKKEKN